MGSDSRQSYHIPDTIIAAGTRTHYRDVPMDHTSTREQVSSALTRMLAAKGIADPNDAVEVRATRGDGPRLFLVIASARANLSLGEELTRITGHGRPAVAGVWILNQAESRELIGAVANDSGSALGISPYVG